MPSFCAILTVGTFIECWATWRIVTGPLKVCSSFCGSQSPIFIGLSLMTVDGENLFSSAAAKTNGLKAEPGWRSAIVARLNWSVPRPPTIALT